MTPRGFDPKAQAGKHPPPERCAEVLVIGAGPAGCAAAITAARSGAQVMLVDENPVSAGLMGLDAPLYYGGRYTGAVQAKARMMEQVFAANPDLEAAFEAGVEVELGVYCWGAWVPGPGLASLSQPMAGLADEDRAWMVGFDRLILAAGARDVALAFPGWDLPGVMGARALASLLETYDAFAGRRLVILGSGDLALDCARRALRWGLDVTALVEARGEIQGPAESAAALAALGVEILTGHVPTGAESGVDGLKALHVRALADGAERTLACDTVVQAVGLTPVIELLDVLGAALAQSPDLGGHAPVSPDGVSTSLDQVFVAGDIAGAPGGAAMDLEAARDSGRRAARAALASLGRADPDPAPPRLDPAAAFDAVAYQRDWSRALAAVSGPSVIICQCEAVTREDLLGVRPPAYLGPPSAGQAARDLSTLLADGPPNQDQIKRLTRAGMGPCQGRRCREQVALILAGASNDPAMNVPLAGYRAPVRPLPLKVLAAWDEAPDMARHWDVWFGITGQWTPYADIGTEREALHGALFGGDLHL